MTAGSAASRPLRPSLGVNQFGIDMDADYNIIMPDQLSTYEHGAQYSLTLTNATLASNLTDLPEQWTVQGAVTRTLFLDQTATATGDWSTDVTAEATGMLTQ